MSEFIEAVFQMCNLVTCIDSLSCLDDWPSVSSQNEVIKIMKGIDISFLAPSNRLYLPPRSYRLAIMKALEKDITAYQTGVKNKPIQLHPSSSEDEDEIFSDIFIEYYMELQQPNADNDELEDDSGYLSYPLCCNDNNLVSSLKRVPIYIKRHHNQVGSRIWSAGLYLSYILQSASSMMQPSPPAQLSGQHQRRHRIMELGAGTGITSLLWYHYLQQQQQQHQGNTVQVVEKLLLTDYASTVMEILDHNIQIATSYNYPHHHSNDNSSSSSSRLSSSSISLESQCIDWSDYLSQLAAADDNAASANIKQSKQLDHHNLANITGIIAADVNYSEDLNLALVALFKAYFSQHTPSSCTADLTMQPSSSLPSTSSMHYWLQYCLFDEEANRLPWILVASTVRNEATFQHFLQTLEEQGKDCMQVIRLEDDDKDKDGINNTSFRRHPLNPYHIPDKKDIALILILPIFTATAK